MNRITKTFLLWGVILVALMASAGLVFAQPIPPPAPGVSPIPVETTFGPPTATQTFSCLVFGVTTFISETVLPPVAVLMMLVVGFLFLVSAGDPGKSMTAKKALLFTIIGVFLLLLAPGIVALIESIFNTKLVAPATCAGTAAVTGTLVNTLVGLVNWLSWFVAVTSVVMGLYGGFLFITAKDDPAQATKARGVIAYTIIGIAVSVIAFSIIALVKGFL